MKQALVIAILSDQLFNTEIVRFSIVESSIKKSSMVSSTPKRARNLEMQSIADKESPPQSRKLCLVSVIGLWSASCQIKRTTSSV